MMIFLPGSIVTTEEIAAWRSDPTRIDLALLYSLLWDMTKLG